MKNTVFAGALATAFLAIAPAQPAEASCRDTNSCSFYATKAKLNPVTSKKATKAVTAKSKSKKASKAKSKTGKKKTAAARKSSSPKSKAQAYRIVPAGGGGEVVGLIKAMAPSYGVPTWFALRIAHVESNYNPHARGSAGELGVFQLKCATAKGIGYRGNCSGLLDARTNVRYGLQHLSLALRSSGGNLKLAASKHNGGLGRKRIVHGYVAKVF